MTHETDRAGGAAPNPALAHRTAPPGKPSTAQLTILAGGLTGRRYLVDEALSIGRTSEADVLLEDPEVSRAHARIQRLPDGRFVVLDLGSRNGTFVNGVRVEREQLVFGDKILVGSTSMVLTRHDDDEEERIQKHRFETLGRLCVGVVHDLNNALCVISSSAEYLSDEDGAGEHEQSECVRDIHAAADRAAKLSRHLVAFARGGGDGPERVEVAPLCVEAVKFASRAFPKSIELAARLEPGLFTIAEPTQLHQILLNLCVNARDAILASGRGGSIRIESKRGSIEPRAGQPHTLLIAVEDDGIGMDEETKARLFEPFFSTKAERGGSGVGLATVADLVARLGGRIRVESVPGAGSSFLIELPLVEPGQRRERRALISTGTATAPSGLGRCVLVVDDDAGVRRSVSRVLRHAGFTVREAEDGARGLVVARQVPQIDLVLLDLDMPRMGGEEVLAQLKQVRPALPIIIVSGHVSPETLARVHAQGARSTIPKPFSSEELLSHIGRALESAGEISLPDDRTLSRDP